MSSAGVHRFISGGRVELFDGVGVAALLAVVFVASYVVFDMVIGDTWTPRETVVAIVGTMP